MGTLAVEEFVRPFYSGKDSMHGLGHVKAMLRKAKELALKHGGDLDVITYAAYLHGVVQENPKKAEKFLEKQKLPKKKRERIMKVARESHAGATARTKDGKILHDAHLLVGGKDSLVVKALATGIERGQTTGESLDFLEKKVLGKHKCYFTESQQEYARKENYAREALKKLRMSF